MLIATIRFVSIVIITLSLNWQCVQCENVPTNAIVWPMNFEIRAGPRPIPERRRRRLLFSKKQLERSWKDQDATILAKLETPRDFNANHSTTLDPHHAAQSNDAIRALNFNRFNAFDSSSSSSILSNAIDSNGPPVINKHAPIARTNNSSTADNNRMTVRIKSKVTAKHSSTMPRHLKLSLRPNSSEVIRCDLSQHGCGLRNDAQLAHKFRRTSISGEGVDEPMTGMLVLGGYSGQSSNQTQSDTAWARLSTPYLPSKGHRKACLKLTWMTAGRLLRSLQVIQQDSQLERVWFHQTHSYMKDDMSVAQRIDMMEIRFRLPTVRFLFTALIRPNEPGFVALLSYELYYASCISWPANNDQKHIVHNLKLNSSESAALVAKLTGRCFASLRRQVTL